MGKREGDGNSTGDQTYVNAGSQIAAWTSQRNHLATPMIALFDTTAPDFTKPDDRRASELIAPGEQLLAEVQAAAA